MRVALRVDAVSLRGLREGVPNLLRLFAEYRVRASFFLPFGPDLSGRSPLATWRARGRLGAAALAYGTLAPAPALGVESAGLLARLREAGHEVGLLGLSPQLWSRRLAYADADWVSEQLEVLWARFQAAGGAAPCALATPDWQVHPALLPLLSPTRFRYSSLSRGRLPYRPSLQGERSAVPEIPTTLPTADELLRQPGVTQDKLHEYLYAESAHLSPAGHVYAVSAEREGIAMLPLMEKLLVMWRGQDGAVRTLGDLLDEIDPATLPHHRIGWGNAQGDSRPVAMQSIRVPA